MSPNKKYEEVLKWTFSFGLDKYRILGKANIKM